MIMMQLAEIADIVGGKVTGTDKNIAGVSIDTRTLSAGDLYIAIKGEQFDGHEYISQAEEKGAVALVVAKEAITQLPQIIVADTRTAWLNWREQ